MLMENPRRRNPDDDPDPEKNSFSGRLPFYTWPLLVCGIAMDIWSVRVAGGPFRLYGTFGAALFIGLSILVLRFFRTRE